ncbi:ATPase [Devosia nitrariae]|uniref:histidine kinase n=2 Tax=Devosia nitrariae TaxID=2071872 RepID=A0ABQ5W6I0_9HYPH|nr:ATPase [Devosia nitrariae]
MILRSLSWRMVALAASWTVIAVLLAALVLQELFSANVDRTLRTDMQASLNRLIAALQPAYEVPAIDRPLPDPLYSTPFSGRYWQIEATDNGQITRSRSLWDQVLATPRPRVADGEVFTRATGPEGQVLALLTRQVAVEVDDGTRGFVITIAEDRRVVDQARVSFRRDMIITLAALGLVIVLAAYLQVKFGLLPLVSIRKEIEAVRRGDQERIGGPYPDELLSLVEEVNDLLSIHEKANEHARSRASDLAHGLKTPLAALQQMAERLREKGQASEAGLIEEVVREMQERVDYQLRLASLRIRSTSHVASASLNAALIRTLMVLKKTARGEDLHWVVELGEDCAIDIHRQDLLELVGIITENAAKWATTSVRINTTTADGYAMVTIADDGPGIAPAQMTELGQRGKRLDETRSGTGLGLAIAAEIVRLNRGEMSFGESRMGGLEVVLKLPLAKTD